MNLHLIQDCKHGARVSFDATLRYARDQILRNNIKLSHIELSHLCHSHSHNRLSSFLSDVTRVGKGEPLSRIIYPSDGNFVRQR